jgi:hypothetical protein
MHAWRALLSLSYSHSLLFRESKNNIISEQSKGFIMNDLLKLAVEVHGGLERWNQLKAVKADMSITGGIWYVKGRPDVLRRVRVS